jgi:hypothetical protein
MWMWAFYGDQRNVCRTVDSTSHAYCNLGKFYINVFAGLLVTSEVWTECPKLKHRESVSSAWVASTVSGKFSDDCPI